MSGFKKLVQILPVLVATGCANTPSGFTDGKSLYPGHGILAVTLESNWSSRKSSLLDPDLDLYYRGENAGVSLLNP